MQHCQQALSQGEDAPAGQVPVMHCLKWAWLGSGYLCAAKGLHVNAILSDLEQQCCKCVTLIPLTAACHVETAKAYSLLAMETSRSAGPYGRRRAGV